MTRIFSRLASAFALLALSLIVAGGIASTQAEARSKPQINTIGSPGVAIKGFDPVAYFTAGKPTRGKKEFETTYKGVKWRFASAENKALFEANPAKYEPAYGGYCAYGVAKGSLVKIEGNAWKIVNGKLYLNYNQSINRTWSKATGRYINQANKRYSGLIN